MKLPAVRTAALLGVAAVVVPIGPTLAHWHLFQQGDPIDQINPGPLGMAHFGKILAGEFNGDKVPDCFVEDAGEPKLVVWPASHKNAHGIGMTVNDFDVFRNIATGKDGLVTVNGDGLIMWVYDEVNDEFDMVGGVPIADDTTAWMEALLVREVEVDGVNGKDIVGVAANGNDVLVMLNQGNNTFTPGTGHTNPNDIYDMVVVNWRETGDTAGTDEIATFTPSNWQVREPTGGQILKTTAWSISTIYGCAIDWGSTTQSLVLVARSGGQDWMATYGVGNFVDGPYALGDRQVVSMASGDANNDGKSDVFLSIQAERKFDMHLQASTLPLFTGVPPTKFAYGTPDHDPTLNYSGLALRDCDGDGYLDVIKPAQGDLTGNIDAYGTLVHKQLGFGSPHKMKVGVSDPYYTDYFNPARLYFYLTMPEDELAVAGCTTKLRIDTWMTDDLQGVTNPIGVSHFQKLPDSDPVFIFELPPGYDPTAGGSHETFSLIFRQVAVSNSAPYDVVHEGPPLNYMFVPQRHYATFAAASDVVDAAVTVSLDQEDIPPSGGGGSGPTTPPPPDGSTPKR